MSARAAEAAKIMDAAKATPASSFLLFTSVLLEQSSEPWRTPVEPEVQDPWLGPLAIEDGLGNRPDPAGINPVRVAREDWRRRARPSPLRLSRRATMLNGSRPR